MKKFLKLLKFLTLFVTLSFYQLRCEIKAIIFDFGGVLAKTSEIKFAREIGVQNLIALGLNDIFNLDFSNLGLKEKVLEIMSELGHQEKCDNGLISKHGQTDLPEIMCKWLCGEISGSDVNTKVQSYLNSLSQSHEKIKSEAEKRVLSNIVKIMFDEQKLAEFTFPIKETLNILSELKACKNIDNNKEKYELLILSNWSSASFNHVCNSQDSDMQNLLNYFKRENIFISGVTKSMKPSNLAYQNVIEHLKKINIKPEECLMIDDQPENIVAATMYCNMQGILVDKTCSNLREELVKQGVLEPKKSTWFSPLSKLAWN